MTSFLNTFLTGILQTQTLANGYIIHTPHDTVLESQTVTFAQSLLFNSVKKQPMDPTTLTDFIEINEEKTIPIATIRMIQEQIKYGPSHCSRFICVVHHAEKLSIEAANAFLKTLEEPPENVHFVLSTSSLHQILPTIRSRCQSIWLPSASNEPSSEIHESSQFFESNSFISSFQKAADLTKDKTLYKQQLLHWIEDYHNKQSSQNTAYTSKINTLIDAYSNTRYTINCRLQLEHLVLSLHHNCAL